MKLVLQEKFYDPYAEFQRKDSSDDSSSSSEIEVKAAEGACDKPY